MIILFLILIIILIYLTCLFFPKIKYYEHQKLISEDKLNLNKYVISKFVTFRSYVHYTRFINLNTKLMDKKKLYDFLKERNIPYPKIYYFSNSDFKVRKVIDNLILNDVNFVVKPTNLSEKLNCIVYKYGINNLNGKKINLDIFNDYKIDKNILTESLTLKNNKPGLIIQESLDVFDEVNEWKVFCCWGKVIFSVWRQNHKYDIGLVDNRFNFRPCFILSKFPELPKFKDKIYNICAELSKGYPFIRIDILWNKEKYVVNEIEFCPSGYYGYFNERLLMNVIKNGYNVKSNKLNYIYEIKSYLYFILNRINCLLI